MVIVGLPDANFIESMTISKLDYTTPFKTCQVEKQKNTMEYNYITTEELLESNNKKYQEILW
jgi:hypothetical protein